MTNLDIENALLGTWRGTAGNETHQYEFQPDHRFTVQITALSQPASTAFGYWSATPTTLRMGTSAADYNEAPITVKPNEFWLQKTRFIRVN